MQFLAKVSILIIHSAQGVKAHTFELEDHVIILHIVILSDIYSLYTCKLRKVTFQGNILQCNIILTMSYYQGHIYSVHSVCSMYSNIQKLKLPLRDTFLKAIVVKEGRVYIYMWESVQWKQLEISNIDKNLQQTEINLCLINLPSKLKHLKGIFINLLVTVFKENFGPDFKLYWSKTRWA